MASFSEAQEYFIKYLRGFLTMRFRTVAGSDYDGIAKLGDEELWEDLRLGINFFNTYPPVVTTYSFQDLYNHISNSDNPDAPETESKESVLITPIMMCSLFFVGMRLQIFEAGKHFEYNDNGISISRKKQADYASITGQIQQYLTTQLILIRKMLAFNRVNIKGMFSGMVSYPRSLTRGLRGTRLGAG